MSDLNHFVVHRFGPDVARDLTLAGELPYPSEKPAPRTQGQRRRLREVERLLAATLALSQTELAECMVLDRYRFRMNVYQHPAGVAVRAIFADAFDRQLYQWVYGQLDDDGVPSPVHGALLAILAGRHLDKRSRELLSGAWDEYESSRRPAGPDS